MKVDFFLIGAPRSGTNAMFSYLKQHPNICFSEPKQPEFFSTDLKSTAPRCTDVDEYHKIFFPHYDVSVHSVVAEGSVFYLYSEKAVDNILVYNENAKFLVMLRNPVEMAYSWYSLTYYGGQENISTFEEAWFLQGIRQEGRSIPKTCIEPKLLQYKKLCSTGSQVASLLKKVRRENICFVVFDDFKRDPRCEYLRVVDFLALPRYESEGGFAQENANREWRSPWVRKLYQLLVGAVKLRASLGIKKGFGISSYLTRFLPVKQQKRIPLSPRFRKKMQEEFRKDLLLLSELLERDLSFWMEEQYFVMINSREAAGVVQKRILDNCLVKDEEKLLVGEVFFVRPVFSFCSGFSVLRFFLAYGVLCHFLRTLFWGKICKVSARGQTVSYAFSPHGEKTPVLVRGWSWYRDFRLRRSRKKYNGLPVLFPWQRLRIEAFAHFALSQYGLAPAFLSYSTKTGMFLREYPKGITLEYVAKEGIWKNLNGEDKEKLLLSIVRAIENMHSLGIVHGDLAPGNILFPDKSFENVFFIDFENAWFSRKNVEYISSEQMYSEEWKRMLERAEVLDKDLFLKMRVFLERENLVQFYAEFFFT